MKSSEKFQLEARSTNLLTFRTVTSILYSSFKGNISVTIAAVCYSFIHPIMRTLQIANSELPHQNGTMSSTSHANHGWWLTRCVRTHLALSLHLQTGFHQARLELLPDEVDLMISRLRCLTPSQLNKHLADAGWVPTGYAAPSLICIGSHRGGEVAVGNDG